MSFNWDHHTEAFGTAIVEYAPPVERKKAKLTSLVYTAAGTAHDLVVMRCIDSTTLTTNDDAAATVLSFTKVTFNDQTLASGDYLLIEHGDGTFEINTVSSVSSLDVTVGTALAKAVVAGGMVWMFGHPTNEASYHVTLKSIASTRQEFQSSTGGLCETGYDIGTYSRTGLGDPLLFYSANGTAAGILNWGSGVYVTT
jgi:hypothetical protein